MKIVSYYEAYRPSSMAWLAYDEDTYDGAPDSGNRHMIGYGHTQAEAIEDLHRLFQEEAEAHEEERERREEAYEKHAADCRETWGRNIFGR